MKLTRIAFLILLPFVFSACDTTGPREVQEATDEKKFVWNGMNNWYFWQNSVPALADDRFTDDVAFNDFLNGFSNERNVFESLLFRQEDDFSFFIDNFEEFEKSRRGQSVSYGFSFGLVRPNGNSSDIFGYVQYVFDSAAEGAGLERGDVFTKVNGTQLTVNNFQDLLSQNSIDLTLADIESVSPFTISDTGITVSVTAQNLQENPLLLTKILEKGTTNIGYLVYNAFRYNFHEELNNAFGEFYARGIDELVIDLRYNGGGALISSSLLASMISGQRGPEIFASLNFNEKRESNNQIFTFLDEYPVWDRNGDFVDTFDNMNRLSLDRLYVLTSNNTASASEALINGLSPFMDVILIGQQTVGKDEGSITVYDSPPNYDNREDANPGHMRALQPIVFKIFNDRMENFPNGFFPKAEVREIDYLVDLPPLGAENEPLLSKALELITGNGLPALVHKARLEGGIMYKETLTLNPFGNDMYLLPGELAGE